MSKKMLLVAAAAAGLWAETASATLLSVPAFAGSTWEPFWWFSNYSVPTYITTLPEGTSILYNAATITSANSDMIVYEPSAGVNFSLFNFGNAPVADGTKGLGLNSYDDTATITFGQKLNAIGGYWGATDESGWGPGTPDITFKFFDAATQVGTASMTYAGGGSLTWAGWFSTVPFDSITVTGDYIVMDGIQSDAAPVPEPASATAILLSVALLGTRRSRA